MNSLTQCSTFNPHRSLPSCVEEEKEASLRIQRELSGIPQRTCTAASIPYHDDNNNSDEYWGDIVMRKPGFNGASMKCPQELN